MSEPRVLLTRALEEFGCTMRPVVIRLMIARFGESWEEHVHRRMTFAEQHPLDSADVKNVLNVMDFFWKDVLEPVYPENGKRGFGQVKYLELVRNVWAHMEPLSADDAYGATCDMLALMTAFGVRKLKKIAELNSRAFSMLMADRGEAQADWEPRQVVGLDERSDGDGERRFSWVVSTLPDRYSSEMLEIRDAIINQVVRLLAPYRQLKHVSFDAAFVHVAVQNPSRRGFVSDHLMLNTQDFLVKALRQRLGMLDLEQFEELPILVNVAAGPPGDVRTSAETAGLGVYCRLGRHARKHDQNSARLVVLRGEVAGSREYPLRPENCPFRIGRGATVRKKDATVRHNQIAFEERGRSHLKISRSHATITWQARSGVYLLEDDKSSFGTIVERRGVAHPIPVVGPPIQLQDGDRVVLGGAVEFEFRLDQSGSETR